MEAVVEWEKTITPTVRRVSELFALADGLEGKYGEAVERVEKLTPAVLAKAFRGELVAQDPGYEPASALLERIRAQRASEDRSGLARKRVGAASRRGVDAVKVAGTVKRTRSGGRRGSAWAA
jgi:type I restriction enzyme S subunit